MEHNAEFYMGACGNPSAPDRTCSHRHTTPAMAEACLARLKTATGQEGLWDAAYTLACYGEFPIPYEGFTPRRGADATLFYTVCYGLPLNPRMNCIHRHATYEQAEACVSSIEKTGHVGAYILTCHDGWRGSRA